MKPACFIVALSAVALPITAHAYCPSYTASSAYNDRNCGIEAVAGQNPSVAQWQDIFALVSQGPAAWGGAGPSVADIGQGCGKPEANHSVSAKFPCEILKAIAMVESGWRQFCVPDRPADQLGPPERTIISFDCGYGIGQVTSGMHVGENPSFDRSRVAGDATYNLATGTQILAAKWRTTNCVGDNQPKVVEHWYTATWAYNGLAWSNNPNNPNHDPSRGIYDPAIGGSYPYQEKVFGRIEHPTTTAHWQSVALAYPDRSECGSSGSPPALSEPSCASPTDCVNKRGTHVSLCLADPLPDAGPEPDAGPDSSWPQHDALLDDAAMLDAPNEAYSDGSGGSSSFDASGWQSPSKGALAAPDDAEGTCACRQGATAKSPPWAWMTALLLGAWPLRRRAYRGREITET